MIDNSARCFSIFNKFIFIIFLMTQKSKKASLFYYINESNINRRQKRKVLSFKRSKLRIKYDASDLQKRKSFCFDENQGKVFQK